MVQLKMLLIKKDESGDNSISEEAAEAIIRDKYQHLAKVMEWVNSIVVLIFQTTKFLQKIGMGLAANAEECKNVAKYFPDDPAFIAFKAERMKKFQMNLHYTLMKNTV